MSTWYVAPTGSNANSGTLQQPFATIQRAANVAGPGDLVLIRAGVYHETVIPANSGTAGAPITFEPYNNESVTIDGADKITGWAGYKANIFNAPDSSDLGEGNNQIFVDGAAVNEARYPNSSANLSAPTWSTATSVKVTQNTTGGLSTVTLYNAALTQPAGSLVGAVAHLAAGSEWVDQTGLIIANAPGSITVSYYQETSYQVPQAGNRFYIVGAFQNLDSAGEWYRDPTSGLLYLWDSTSDSPSGHTVEAKARLYGFDLRSRAYISVEGINLFACTVNTDANSTQIFLDHLNATYVSQMQSIVADTQDPWGAKFHPHNTGIILNGQYDTLQNSTIAYSSGDGVFVGGANNTVQNCLIHDADYEAGDEAPIDTLGANEKILYNTIYNAGRGGIVLRYTTSSQFEHNNIYGVGLQMTDLGGIYTWGTDGLGTEIAYNTVSGVHTAGYGGAGIYLDNTSQDYVVDHNLVYGCDFALKLNPASINNLVINNTFQGTSYGLQSSGDETMTGTVIENNIFNKAVMTGPGVTLSNNETQGSNPQFVNTTAANYQLLTGSPAINAGIVAAPYTNGYLGKAPDIGAYEYGQLPWSAGYVATPFVSITVVNPTVAISGSANANPAAFYSLNLGATVDGAFTVSQYIVHWGDGTTGNYTSSGIVTHSFANSSTASVSDAIVVDLIDNSGPAGANATIPAAGAMNLTINPNPSLALGGAPIANVGGNYQLAIGTLIDPGFSVTQLLANWGDGSAPTPVTPGTTWVSHLFSSAGTDSVSVDLTDNSGIYPGAGLISVSASKPALTLTGNPAAINGQTYQLTINPPTDLGGTPQQYVVHWGDSASSTYAVSNPAAAFVATHTYTTDQTMTASVDLIDNTGVFASAATLPLAIVDPASVTLAGASQVNVGIAYTLSLTGALDPVGAISSFIIHWGDGATSTVSALGDLTHVYSVSGTPTIMVDRLIRTAPRLTREIFRCWLCSRRSPRRSACPPMQTRM